MHRKVAVVLFSVAVLLGASLGDALAGLGATTGRTQSVSVPKWSVVFSAATANAATTGPRSTPLDADSYFWITNNGTVSLDPRFTVTISLTTTGGATAQLEQCRGAAAMVTSNWEETTGVCTGTIDVVAYSGTPAPYVLPAAYPVGAAVRLRVHVTALGAGNTGTVSVTIKR